MDRPIRILVVEEDPLFLKMIKDSLRESGGLYMIDQATSGKEGLIKLQNETFDLLLLDHLLPDGT